MTWIIAHRGAAAEAPENSIEALDLGMSLGADAIELDVQRTADGALFVIPVTIDDTDAAQALVPDRFKALHFTRLRDGEVTSDFAQRLADFTRARQP